jgi:hypothetical protein
MTHMYRIVLAFLIAAVVAACAPQEATVPLTLEGPATVATVGETVNLTTNVPGVFDWAVDGVVGGEEAVGFIDADGVFTAPARVPRGGVVEITVSDPLVPGRTATTELELRAPGTHYVYGDVVHVYAGMDEAAGNLAPTRSFTLDGIDGPFYDMTMAPAADTAFISVQRDSPMLFRVPLVSVAEGAVTDYSTFDDAGYANLSSLAYDPIRDLLYARYIGGLLVYEGASTAPTGAEAAREVSGPAAGGYAVDWDVRLALDPAADRLFVVRPDGVVGVFENASTIDGDLAPDFEFTVDTPGLVYLWGAAYDPTRDELYLADQRVGAAIYVVENASMARGTVQPVRTIGGPNHPLDNPSMISYDPSHDRLVVNLGGVTNGVAVFDDASRVTGDVAPTRTIGGSLLPISNPYGGYYDATQ